MNTTRSIPIRAGLLALVLLPLLFVNPLRTASQGGPDQTCNYVAAHGSIFDMADGSEVQATPDTIGTILHGLETCAEQNLSEDQKTVYQEQSGAILTTNQDPMQKAEQALVHIELADAISGSDMVGKQSRIARQLLASIGDVDINAIMKRRNAIDVLTRNGWQRVDPSHNHRDAVSDYQNNCKKDGVPLPGAMVTDRGWSPLIDASADAGKYFFAPEKTVLKLWTYAATNKGTCIALLRQKPGGQPFIGAICVDEPVSHACLFDNLVYADNGAAERIDEETLKVTDFSKLVHPLDFAEHCNSCHMGDDPFLAHPETILGKTLNPTMAPTKDLQFQFVEFGRSLENWVNPDPIKPINDAEGACMRCHDIAYAPGLGSGNDYCNIVKNAAERTMPPPPKWTGGNKKLWPDDQGCFPDEVKSLQAFFTSLRKIKAMCTGQAVGNCPAG